MSHGAVSQTRFFRALNSVTKGAIKDVLARCQQQKDMDNQCSQSLLWYGMDSLNVRCTFIDKR